MLFRTTDIINYAQTPGTDVTLPGAIRDEMVSYIFIISPNISIDFMAFDGEELGLIGSTMTLAAVQWQRNVLLM